MELLRALYFDGPTLGGYGFWGGADRFDVCHDMTGVDSSFWARNVDECGTMLERRFHAFLIGSGAALAATALVYAVGYLSFYLCLQRPIQRLLQEHVQQRGQRRRRPRVYVVRHLDHWPLSDSSSSSSSSSSDGEEE